MRRTLSWMGVRRADNIEEVRRFTARVGEFWGV